MLQRWYPDGYLSIYSDGLEPTRDHSRFRLFKLLYDVEYFPKGFFPKWQLHRGIFPNVQFPKRQLYKSVLAAALGPPACSSRSAHPPIAACGALEGLT